MSNLVAQWRALDRRQNKINDQHKGSGEKSQRKLDTINYIINMEKIDLQNQMTKTELEQT